jgi:DNA-directed RNA polymerase subunit RPC12/RpoP
MKHTFYIYKCSECGKRETYALRIPLLRRLDGERSIECQVCGASMDEDGTRQGTLTLHPRTGKLAIEEDLRWPGDYPDAKKQEI